MSELHELVTESARRQGISLNARQAALVAEIGWSGRLPEDKHAELLDRFEAGELDQDVLTALGPNLWRNRPDGSGHDYTRWRELLRACRYTRDFHVARRPRGRTLAFRGATEANREGISWSLDISQADYFARSRQDPHGPRATIWACWIPAARELARIGEHGWEKEIVADVRGLSIAPALPLSARTQATVRQRRIRARLAGEQIWPMPV
jgi:hypothetical protein